MARLATVLCIGLFTLLASNAYAEDREAARKAYAEGTKYYDLSQYADALESFKRAYWNYEEPSFLFNIAQCQRALGRKKDAVESYRSYLRKSPDAPNRDEVRKLVADLETAIAQEKVLSSAPPQGTMGAATPAPSAPAVTSLAAKPDAAHSAAAAPTANIVSRSAPPPDRPTPAYKRAWVWCLVGAVVVAGVGVGLGVGLTSSHAPMASDGAVRF